MLKQFHI